MLILKLLGILMIAVTIYQIIKRFNVYTDQYIRYKYFTMDHTIAMVIGYGLMVLGNIWRKSELTNPVNGDPLSGVIVIIIGVLIVAGVIKNNFNKTPRRFAIAGSLMQIIFYIPIVIGIIPIVMGIFAFFSNTKPVYTINEK